MRYKKFIIKNYRGIIGPLEISVEKATLIPIIGINECGKTTILKAIFSFDFHNDSLNENVKHLDDIDNLYKTKPLIPEISAEIEISAEEMKDTINEFKDNLDYKSSINSYKRNTNQIKNITITRNLKTKEYSLNNTLLKDKKFNNEISESIIRSLPYILFFDDFRDSIQEKIEIKTDDNKKVTGWLAIVSKLFKTTNKDYDVLDLPKKEERVRKSILSQVNKTLEKSLTREWQNFRLDDKDALKINIDYKEENDSLGQKRYYLKFDVIETDENGHEHYFFIGDRSKGFYWFFNFVMKLEFNPKVVEQETGEAIYLLDEPGSYLHATAQSKLCKKLKQLSEKNKVIYCTHSHYLLNPEEIPINSIRVAVKDPKQFNIDLKSIYEYEGNITDTRSAFQPIIDALQIKPFIFDLNTDKIIITEGIYDYYCLELFKDTRNINFLPSVNAESIKYYISLMITMQKNYNALWDNDEEGRKEKESAERYFGEQESKKFILLPKKRGKKMIIQNLFDGNDIKLIKTELNISTNSSFEKMILTLFYSPQKDEIIGKISNNTKGNFKELYKLFV